MLKLYFLSNDNLIIGISGLWVVIFGIKFFSFTRIDFEENIRKLYFLLIYFEFFFKQKYFLP